MNWLPAVLVTVNVLLWLAVAAAVVAGVVIGVRLARLDCGDPRLDRAVLELAALALLLGAAVVLLPFMTRAASAALDAQLVGS